MFKVVINDEDQYSIWPEGRDNPAGWYDEGVLGDRETCLAHIEQVWTDMRPRSLRLRMEGREARTTWSSSTCARRDS